MRSVTPLGEIIEHSTDSCLQIRKIANDHLPNDRRIDMPIAVGQEIPHVYHQAPRNIGMSFSGVLRYCVGGLSDGLDRSPRLATPRRPGRPLRNRAGAC